jgi:hypothetical protein
MKAVPFRLLASATVLGTLFLAILLLGDLHGHLVETIILYSLSSLVYIVSTYLVLKIPKDGKCKSSNRLGLFIGISALVFRLTVWPLYPALSDDPYRYRWEGKLQAHGGNPYQVRPNDPEWAHLRDSTFPSVVGKDFKAGYGPLLELLELGTYRAVSTFWPDPQQQVFWFKAPFALFDLGVIFVLWSLLRARGLPGERVLIYAWSPLPVMEFWATGHNDSVAVFFVLLALLAAAKERWTLAFVGLSLAAAAKIWPLLLLPIFVGWKGERPQRWHQWWVLFPVAAVLMWPYWSDVMQNVRFMSGFVGGWRNNDSLFGLLLWFTNDIYRAKYLAFAVIAAGAVVVTLCRWELEKAVLAALVIMLMVSANCHVWYLTWILPLLAFLPVPALLLWTGLMPLAYEVLIGWVELGEWQGSTDTRWYIYVPVYAMLVGSWLARQQLFRRRGAAG